MSESHGCWIMSILIVGAGGIGCELIKTCVLAGHRSIHVVDMDTIEVSNLNRQFLFRRHHVGQFKADVACDAITKLLIENGVDEKEFALVSHCHNIKDTTKFPLSFFQSFDVVLGALDNVDARRYINSMCLMAQVPLVESGTAGYFGQCTVIRPNGLSECYDCTEKPQIKTYPVCTIRSTPSLPIHCVVWAKDYLFPLLFGPLESITSTIAEEEDQQKLHFEQEALVHQSLQKQGRQSDCNVSQWIKQLITQFFVTDIEKLCSLDVLWTDCPKPVPLDISTNDLSVSDPSITLDQHQQWSIEQWLSIFAQSTEKLRSELLALEESTTTKTLFFDKDHSAIMDFVAAAANLRASIFHIPLTAHFDLKAMAGNIIPAIATTNAIAAGLAVIQLRLLLPISSRSAVETTADDNADQCQTVFIPFGTQRKTLFACEGALAKPNPSCPTCRKDRVIISANTHNTTISQVIQQLLKELSQFDSHRDISIEDVSVIRGDCIIFDPDIPPSSSTLNELQCTDSVQLTVEFLVSNALCLPMTAMIQHVDSDEISIQLSMLPLDQRQLVIQFKSELNQQDSSDQETDALLGGEEEPPAKRSRTASDNEGDLIIDDQATVLD